MIDIPLKIPGFIDTPRDIEAFERLLTCGLTASRIWALVRQHGGDLELISSSNAALLLGLSSDRAVRTLRYRLSRRGLNYGEKIGRDWFFTKAEIQVISSRPKGRGPNKRKS